MNKRCLAETVDPQPLIWKWSAILPLCNVHADVWQRPHYCTGQNSSSEFRLMSLQTPSTSEDRQTSSVWEVMRKPEQLAPKWKTSSRKQRVSTFQSAGNLITVSSQTGITGESVPLKKGMLLWDKRNNILW